MSKKRSKIRWKNVLRMGNLIFQIGWRVLVFFLVLALALFLYRGMHNKNYAVEAFHVPKGYVDAGLNGVVFANKLMDEVQAVDDFIASVKERPTEVQSGIQPDLNFQVMGIGLTVNSITYFLKEIFGKERRAIGGELTDIDQKLELTLRITGHQSEHFAVAYEQGKREEALQHLMHEAAKVVIGLLDPYRLSVYHYKKKEMDKSLELIMDLIANKPDEAAWGYLAWGNILNTLDRPEEACEKFQKSIEHQSGFRLAYANWAWTELRQRNYKAAIPLFERANQGHPKVASYYNGIAMCYRNMKEYEKAETYFAKASASDPEHTLWWNGNWAGMKYFNMQDTIGAMRLMKKTGDEMKEGGSKYLAYSAYYYYKNEPDSAQQMAELALEIAPSNLMALTQVTNFYYDSEANERCVESSKRKIKILLSDRNVENWSNQLLNTYNVLAMCDYRLEQYDSALVHVNLAIEVDPSNAIPYTTLAETYAYMGDHEKFYEALEMAVNRGYDFEEIKGDEPYNRYQNEERFLRLIRKNEQEESQLEAALN